MSEPLSAAPDRLLPDPAVRHPVRPVGTWVVAGFLMVTAVVIWVGVALVFAGRS